MPLNLNLDNNVFFKTLTHMFLLFNTISKLFLFLGTNLIVLIHQIKKRFKKKETLKFFLLCQKSFNKKNSEIGKIKITLIK